MKGTIVKEQDFEFILILFTQLIEIQLETIAIAFGQLQYKMSSGYWRECTKEVEVFKLMLVAYQRLDTFDGKHSAWNGQQSEAALILKVNIDCFENI